MASRDLKIYCAFCGVLTAKYGKKGSGALLRLYLDRILEGGSIPFFSKIIDYPSTLKCSKCKTPLGSLIKKTGRPVYRLIPGAIRKTPPIEKS